MLTAYKLEEKKECQRAQYRRTQRMGAAAELWLACRIETSNQPTWYCPMTHSHLFDFNTAVRARQDSIGYTGTPGYVPPDISIKPWDTSCDLFAVGVVLYELIAGAHPYSDRNPSDPNPTNRPTTVFTQSDSRTISLDAPRCFGRALDKVSQRASIQTGLAKFEWPVCAIHFTRFGIDEANLNTGKSGFV